MRADERIRRAALRLFSEKGFYQTSTKEISKEAGVGKGSLYWHWKNKEELAFDLVSAMLERFLGIVEAAAEESGPISEKLPGLAQSIADLYEMEKEHCRLLWKFRADKHYMFSPEYKDRVSCYYERIRKAIACMIRKGMEEGEIVGVDPNYAALLIVGVTEGIEVEWLENERDFPIRKALSDAYDLLLKGLKAANAQSLKGVVFNEGSGTRWSRSDGEESCNGPCSEGFRREASHRGLRPCSG